MMNIDNFGIANGILQSDPVILNNQDGSKKVLMTVICSDMTRDQNGNRTFQNIPIQGFIPKSYKGIGPYAYLHQGDEVHVEYTIKANPYLGENSIILQIDSIKFGKDIKAKITKSQEPLPQQKETPPAQTESNTPVNTTQETPEPQPAVQNIEPTPAPEDFDLDLDLDL